MLTIYNSLTRKIEEFEPLNPPIVSLYACGPTVYSFAHIGNFRTYMMTDLLIRTLKSAEYQVNYVMNLTDVGHLTGDNLGDADTGEDRMEKTAQKEGKTAWEVAAFYTDAFLSDYTSLNLTKPLQFAKATDNIKEQIALVQTLEEKGFTYTTSDGVYFDTAAFPEYGQLSNLDEIKEGARVEINPEKRNPRDFALWKFSPTDQKRQMEWDSPWALPDGRQVKGFPGWHIECSAMSMKFLGETIDIHTGGMDLRETHHPNEIAQSEAATGKPFVRFWVHSAFMLVDGQKMSKSLKNTHRVYDLEKEGFEPLALRYLYMQTHYRQEMNFTFTALEAAQNALQRLRREVLAIPDGELLVGEYEKAFIASMQEDLNTSRSLAIMWEMLKSDIPAGEKLHALYAMDEILGFGLKAYREEQLKLKPLSVPIEVRELAEVRQQMRKTKQFGQADQLRNKILKMGFEVVDVDKGFEIRKA